MMKLWHTLRAFALVTVMLVGISVANVPTVDTKELTLINKTGYDIWVNGSTAQASPSASINGHSGTNGISRLITAMVPPMNSSMSMYTK